MTEPRSPVSTEYVSDTGVVESAQRTTLLQPVVPFDDAGAGQLARWYWACVRRSTRGLVRPRAHPGGLSLFLLGVLPLLRFAPVEEDVTPERVACAFPITGGLLALAAGGRLVVEQRGGAETTLSISVSDYHARLARRQGWLYRRVQAPAHLAVSRLFLQLPGRVVER